MCLLTSNPISITIQNKTAETVVQVYLQHIYATFGGSLAFKTENRKEVKNELFQKLHLN